MSRPTICQSPTCPTFVQNPYPVYRSFRQHEVFWWDEYDMWVFPRFEDVNAIFRDRRFGREILHLATREELGWDPIPEHLEAFYAFEAHSLLEKEPPKHTRLRSLINRAFVSASIEGLRPRIQTLAFELAQGLKEGDDLIERYCTPIPITIIAELLGVPLDMAPQLLDWSHRMVALYQARRDREIEDSASAATQAFSTYIRDLIRRRRQDPAEDLLSVLIATEEAGDRLSVDEVVATAILLLNAGHEATVHALGNSIRTLLGHDVPLRDEISGNVVEELLRFDPPLHMFTRYVLNDLDWNGVALKKGAQVGLLIGSANHDERANRLPEIFDPARVRPRHVSLGGGVHFCVGAPLARIEMQIALSTLFDVLGSEFRVQPGPYRNAYHFRGLTALHLAERPRAQAAH
ncbi:MAG: cytochrome P450 [Pseudomonadota bacterium]